MIGYVVIFLLVSMCILFWKYLKASGFFEEVVPYITTEPKHVSKQLTIYYKYHVGPHTGTRKLLEEAQDLTPEFSTTFCIYYDVPGKVSSSLLQSAAGVVFGADGKDFYSETTAEALVAAGFEKMILPKVSRAVEAVQPSTGGLLSQMALFNRTYVNIHDYIGANRIDVQYPIEFYDFTTITVVYPLDNIEEFVVPDYLPTDQLESKLARKKFDSDEEDSESEPDGEEIEEDQ